MQVLHADAFDILRAMPDRCVDLVITDPPYDTMEEHRNHGTTTRLTHSTKSSNDWFPVIHHDRLPKIMRELYRVLKQNTHLYLFCDAKTMFWAKAAGESAGFKFWKPLVYVKHRIGMGYHYRAQYEFILFFEKGKRRLQSLSISDVLFARSIRGGYPAEKPVEVLVPLVYQSSLPGELVFDPFCGSGSTGYAAMTLDRDFLGVDLRETGYRWARDRLAVFGIDEWDARYPTGKLFPVGRPTLRGTPSFMMKPLAYFQKEEKGPFWYASKVGKQAESPKRDRKRG